MKKLKASVVLATYNERENIVPLISAIIKNLSKNKLDYDIVVVDDSSPDGTSEAVRKAYSKNKKVRLIIRQERGLATALRRGVEESKGDVILMMDTDFSHSPEQVSELVRLADDAGASNGSRFVRGGRFIAQLYRQLGTYLIQLFARIILWVPVTDFTNGFVAVKAEHFRKLNLNKVFFGYGDYCIRLFYYLHSTGVRIAEIPSTYKPRVSGKSKTNEIVTALSYILKVIRLRFGF
ncbi:glycosyltransferase [Candidatus Woesearchaeota archaeon]|nr:glycosyltransferase [Candidatus Woesearchaeota archaeon]